MIRLLFKFADGAAKRRLRAYLVVAALSSALLGVLLVLLIPLIRALLSGEPRSALPWVWTLAGVGAAALLLEVSGTVLGQRVGASMILRMHEVIGDRIMRLPLGWFDDERVGRISQMTTGGVTFAANATEGMLRPVLQALLPPFLVSLAVIGIDPIVGWAMVIGLVLVVALWRWTRLRNQRFERRADESKEESAARVLEFAAAQPAVRAAGPDSLAERSVRASLREQRVATERVLTAKGRGMALYSLVAYAVLLVVIGLSIWRVASGALDGADFTVLVVLQIVSNWFATQGLPFGEGIDLATRTLREIDGLLRAPTLPEPDPEHAASPTGSGIDFADVTFSYVPGTPVIQGASFSVPEGGMTAIVGPSGSGKTTIARLIARFFDVDSGSVSIGGVDVRALGTDRTLGMVSMVFQDVYLFEDSLRENIRLGRADASDAEVEEVARRAGVTEIAERLPEGFDTLVGESGGTLSGGERQRVSIARALLKDAPIVLLDEATAALDIESEALVQRGLAELTGEKTLVVIAHRLQTIRRADQIVVLGADGRVEAVGDHERLLSTSPTYAGFWEERSESLSWRINAA